MKNLTETSKKNLLKTTLKYRHPASYIFAIGLLVSILTSSTIYDLLTFPLFILWLIIISNHSTKNVSAKLHIISLASIPILLIFDWKVMAEKIATWTILLLFIAIFQQILKIRNDEK